MNVIAQEEIYNDSHQIIVDVRSPGEYEAYHIHGAINMPLFTDDERQHIGTVYKQVSDVEAKKIGMDYTAKKLNAWMTEVLEWTSNFDRIILYCQRGGMRSKSLVALFNSIGFDSIHQLEGGIKGHRQYISDSLPGLLSQKTYVVLHGNTGVGKTLLLKALQDKKIGVMDLEKMAENAGSVFGDILYPAKSPSQKQFEEKLYHTLRTSPTDYLFTESESKRIGHVILPPWMMTKMEEGKHILVDATIDVRTHNLISDYDVKGNEDAMIHCVECLRKRISNETADQLIDDLNQNRIEEFVATLLVHYYDPLYAYTINKYTYDYRLEFLNLDQAVEALETVYRKDLQ